MKNRIDSTLCNRLAVLAAILAPLAGLPHAAFAQAAAPSAATNPPASANSSAAEPPPFRTAFEDYKPYTDEKIQGWKQANDNVGQIGGWREYAREGSRLSTPKTPEKPVAVSPASPAAEPGADATGTRPKAGSAKP